MNGYCRLFNFLIHFFILWRFISRSFPFLRLSGDIMLLRFNDSLLFLTHSFSFSFLFNIEHISIFDSMSFKTADRKSGSISFTHFKYLLNVLQYKLIIHLVASTDFDSFDITRLSANLFMQKIMLHIVVYTR